MALTRKSYTVGIVCPKIVEMIPIVAFLDKQHPPLPSHCSTYQDAYTFGCIGNHNVIVAVLPETGNIKAASAVARLKKEFNSIEIGIVVGVAGGIPDTDQFDIRLGDVVVGKATGTNYAAILFDQGKQHPDKFEQTGLLSNPPEFLMTHIEALRLKHERQGDLVENVQQARTQLQLSGTRDCVHQGHPDCKTCPPDKLVNRAYPRQNPPNPPNSPKVHFGPIGSPSALIRDATTREELRRKLGVIAVEMEAAGSAGQLPCLVVRGICDYADSHKNKRWQPYAAATAAAYASERRHGVKRGGGQVPDIQWGVSYEVGLVLSGRDLKAH
ncbi:purine and uridine phosphorylase [Aspergillus sclerotioniger CBS 115572]|uniref:Purine and uridine phosphorylase n=1 Tax=Aspergillus sclerotioniger CBS 115572 TaxID=1450535 RepID=A0A317VGY4_9EURO|nr:purine and uridine phosphorylase [Aspergillus sclerotioniger CBS 115572]PWY73215.1 purine and uridine phosphorylase [Aspergillus sclerotioniger CBS 115572]